MQLHKLYLDPDADLSKWYAVRKVSDKKIYCPIQKIEQRGSKCYSVTFTQAGVKNPKTARVNTYNGYMMYSYQYYELVYRQKKPTPHVCLDMFGRSLEIGQIVMFRRMGLAVGCIVDIDDTNILVNIAWTRKDDNAEITKLSVLRSNKNLVILDDQLQEKLDEYT